MPIVSYDHVHGSREVATSPRRSFRREPSDIARGPSPLLSENSQAHLQEALADGWTPSRPPDPTSQPVFWGLKKMSRLACCTSCSRRVY